MERRSLTDGWEVGGGWREEKRVERRDGGIRGKEGWRDERRGKKRAGIKVMRRDERGGEEK